ncbi:DUF6892 domain-containing protein [Olleya namhaensis]|uniref:Uncharacterized protein n=1 Tax=Olleya namhaensis TaxID=1144750 RepID=A0A1I3QE99_9FLAO|nr:hypothetical protein [Olleya namhaensis]SFJ32060.1 hypothetical protein SAMN05443431_10695 [Olleya namhaensis]
MITLRLTPTSFEINAVSITFPVAINSLKDCLKANFRQTNTKNNTLFTWDDLGIIAYSENGELVDSLTLELEPEAYDFSPKSIFSGTFYFKDEDISKYYNSHKNERVELFDGDDGGALVLNNISAWFDVNDDAISAIEISPYQSYTRGEGIPKDKYTIKPLDEAMLHFTDFGFKLSVIETLMYEKEVLLPKFDLYEFANWYQPRKIDIDAEGYDPIPEAEQYFKDLPIPLRLASELTEIYQDGGNDIYMNLAPFSGGAVTFWDIESTEDVKQFPNLKTVTLCYAKEKAYNEFIEMGIKTEWL